MNKILIIPDIHGRGFWKTPCNNWEGDIVFLGDYHDPYEFEINGEQSLRNLRELVEFVENRRRTSNSKTVCLIGNHDYSYITGFGQCRFDRQHCEEVKQLLSKLHLQFLCRTSYVLFSHAGITQNWVDKWFAPQDLDDSLFNNINSASNNSAINSRSFKQIPWSRGGNSSAGSLIWNSLEDFQEEEPFGNYYQIFGHTWGGRTKPVIEDKYAMLDCCKAFVLDVNTKELIEWKNYQEKNLLVVNIG